MSTDSSFLPCVALHLVAFQEKLVEKRLHPGGWEKNKCGLANIHHAHTRGWKVVPSVIEVSVLFMHGVSSHYAQLSPGKWLVSHPTGMG